MKKKIMIFCDFYLPGYQSGGGVRTVVNLIEHFKDRYDFYVVTRNYAGKSDTAPYQTVRTDEWNKIGGALVFYFSKKTFSQNFFSALIAAIEPDAFYLNSAFALPVIKFLIARRRRLFAAKPVILAPCGEFAEGALALKSSKKKVFLSFARRFKLYENIVWKASSEIEKAEIGEVAGRHNKITVAPDLAPRQILADFTFDWKPPKVRGKVKLVTLARIARNKNIHFLLERLGQITTGEIVLDIIGPVEDAVYWAECRKIIARLPPRIEVRQSGAMPHSDALRQAAESHFFVLPTFNENFGYALLEALAAGCPVITTDRTAWTDLEEKNAGWQISLDKQSEWIEKINYCLQIENAAYAVKSRCARRYAVEWIADNAVYDANRRIFEMILPTVSASRNTCNENVEPPV